MVCCCFCLAGPVFWRMVFNLLVECMPLCVGFLCACLVCVFDSFGFAVWSLGCSFGFLLLVGGFFVVPPSRAPLFFSGVAPALGGASVS